jgi:2-keto-4-pentenoate hydratase
MTQNQDIVDVLWRLRRTAETVIAPPMAPEEGFDILRKLVARAIDDGDEVIGWKIARLPSGEDESPFVFAAPVFTSSLQPVSGRRLASPKLEVELVAVIDALGGDSASPESDTWKLSWRVGLEIAANNARDGHKSPGWAIADWGLHAAVVLGDHCRQPTPDEALSVRIAVEGAPEVQQQGAWRIGRKDMIDVLHRDCPRVARPCRSGDLVWTGALVAPMPLPVEASLLAEVEGLGSVKLSAA